MSSMDPAAALAALAARAGVDTSYLGWDGQPVQARADALCAVLRAFGHDVRDPDDAARALAVAERAHWAELAPPVAVAWDGGELALALRVPAERDDPWEVELVLESGARRAASGRLFDLPASDHAWPEALGGQVHCVRYARIGVGEPGYHALTWRVGAATGRTHVIAAPTVAWGAPGTGARRWGAFAPLYAARTPGSGGAGDLRTLAALRRLVADRGGAYLATLPLLAAFLDEPCQASPYSPASRLGWNELYLALADDTAAWRAAAAERAARFREPLVDYRRQYAWRRAAIDEEAARAWGDPVTAAAMRAFAATGPVVDYAMFRALGEAQRAPWSAWPAAIRDGAPVATDIDHVPALPGLDPARVRAHVFAQWAMDQQLTAQEDARCGLYLDLPVGVGCDAYEVWRHRELFALEAAAGAPPDALFLGGQDWGLPPLRPAASRATGHAYFAACVRHHMHHAGMLRVDHVMGLWRLYCVPRGFGAREGVYVRYPADELCAVLTLESHRNRCAVAGEDLGTVPDHVRPAMARHGFFRLHVGQFAMPAAAGQAPGVAAPEAVASLNTHDTATFGGWWRGTDVDDRRALGLIDDARAAAEHAERLVSRAALLAHVDAAGLAPPELDDAQRAMHGAMVDLARGPAEVVLVTLEDLWLEPAPQNVPGTSEERPNWRRPLARGLDALGADPDAPGAGEPALLAALDAVAAARAPIDR